MTDSAIWKRLETQVSTIRFVIDVARTVHETMAMLDCTSEFGQGIVSKRSQIDG